MNKMKWIIFAGVVIAIFTGVIIINKNNTKQFTGDASKIITEHIADHVFGTTDQKVVLIEYGDYQCPGCGSMYAPIKQLAEKYDKQVTFIFRNMPLTNLHANALAAATAAEAAGLQGKYYEMHDILYENQDAWKDIPASQRGDVFAGYASQLGLDTARFKEDLNSKDIQDKINRDRTTGTQKFGVDSTPSFVLNGELLSGKNATDIAAITQKVEAAIAKAYPGTAATQQPATQPAQ